MTLKKKLVFLLMISGGILILLFFTAFHLTIRPSLDRQKLIFIETLKKKIRIALSIEEENIDIHCNSWANWDIMANYVENPSREFEIEMFPDMIFLDDIVDVIQVVRISPNSRDEEMLYFNCYNDKEFISLERMGIKNEIKKLSRIIKRNPMAIGTLLSTKVGPIMVVANPIMTGIRERKLIGILILARFIDEKFLGKMSQNILEEVKLYSSNHDMVNQFYSQDMKKKDLFFMENNEKLSIFYMLKDIHQRPALILYTQADNRLFRVVNQHFITYIIITGLSIVFLGLLLYFSIQKYIIFRMLNISKTMNKIESLEDLSKRIQEDKKNDEISHLISNINLMLDKLENEKVRRENAEKTMITQGKLVSIGRLASCISHEVNNPLLAIGNSIQVIKKISRSKSSLFRDAIEICDSEIGRIRDIISSLLDFHRMEKDEFSNLEVNEVMVKSLDVLKWTKKIGSIKIIQKMDEKCYVYGSSTNLKQVFINFILNAVEAIEGENFSDEQIRENSKNGTLKIKVKNNKQKNLIEVHFLDNGPGVPLSVKSHLFEPFVSTKEVKGVGLGLYVSYKIIDNHSGEIIYNENFKKGAHFIIKLPAMKRIENG